MNLKIKGVEDLNTDKERIELEALDDDNTTNYILLYTSNYENIEVANRCTEAFWFPSQVLKKGDTVRVFTKSGQSSSIRLSNKGKRYTFYWGLKPATIKEDRQYPKLLRIIELSNK
jgi:hypothetical protein